MLIERQREQSIIILENKTVQFTILDYIYEKTNSSIEIVEITPD